MSDHLARTAALLPLLLASAPPAAGHTAEVSAPRYHLVRELGRGAMGVVYLAEQQQPVQRLVALKVAHAPPVTPAMRAQLEFEPRALASLQHDHIARLFDTGTTDDGRPWLAMEHIDGEPLDTYCDRRGLAVPERVRLLAQVAHAVDHAHTRGVLHGDLKPENILVTEIDGQPVPKLIDFGLASPLRGTASAAANDFAHNLVAGTPAYMAPEQFTMPRIDIDARADVFALGVILHEQLTGRSPFAAPTPGAENLWLRAQTAPALPSTHWQRRDARTQEFAARRRNSPRRLARLLRTTGLDRIAASALAPGRDARIAAGHTLAAALTETITQAQQREARWRRLVRGAWLAGAGLLGGLLAASIV